MVEFMREKYWQYDYEEVMTPNIFNFDLWKTSGHADHYRWAGAAAVAAAKE
jgi:threonyl-tRNA synthetase